MMKAPANWKIKRLENIVQFSSGGTPSKSRQDYWEGNIPWISASTMHDDEISDSELYISDEGARTGSKIAKVNDLLLLVRGSMLWKKIPICICKREVAFNQDVKAMHVGKDVNPKYLQYWFLANQRFLLNKVVGTGIGAGKLDFDELKVLEIVLPPLPEQRAIADLLATWDEAIEKTDRLILLKKKQLKCLIDYLCDLACDDVKILKLGKLGDVFCGLSGKNKDDFGEGSPFVTYRNVFSNTCINPADVGYVKINGDKQNLIKYGDVLFTLSSETPEEVGMSSVVLHEPNNLYLNSFCIGFRLYDLGSFKPEYMRFYFRSTKIRKSIIRLAQGSTRFNLPTKEFLKIDVSIPDIRTQDLVSSILKNVENELSILVKQQELIASQKRGLMQKLLAGTWRIKPEIIEKYTAEA